MASMYDRVRTPRCWNHCRVCLSGPTSTIKRGFRSTRLSGRRTSTIGSAEIDGRGACAPKSMTMRIADGRSETGEPDRDRVLRELVRRRLVFAVFRFARGRRRREVGQRDGRCADARALKDDEPLGERRRIGEE